MINKALKIADGWKNVVKSKLGVSSEQDEKIFKARREICDACVHKSKMDRCLKCGCPLVAKTRSLREDNECPIGLW